MRDRVNPAASCRPVLLLCLAGIGLLSSTPFQEAASASLPGSRAQRGYVVIFKGLTWIV
jgi:hypothetical protein